MKLRPDKLFEYGIHTEQTTHRIHVCPKSKLLFVYLTQNGLNALPEPISITNTEDWEASGYYLLASPQAKREFPGLATARGVRVPHIMIKDCRGVKIPDEIQYEAESGSTSAKGRLAIEIVREMARVGRLPLHFTITEVDTKAEQIYGKDIELGEAVIQVKHDGPGYDRGLFMQTHEWNPCGAH